MTGPAAKSKVRSRRHMKLPALESIGHVGHPASSLKMGVLVGSLISTWVFAKSEDGALGSTGTADP